MAVFRTSQCRPVCHCHLGEPPECESVELTPAKIIRYREAARQFHPDAVEIRLPTLRYNCFAYALARSHGWFNCFKPFFTDDYTEVSFDSPARGDVVVYTRYGISMHVALVTRVSGGQITRVRSKWAYWGEFSHCLTDVGKDYGSPSALLRPRTGVVPFPDVPDDEEMPECTNFAPFVILKGGEVMPEFDSTEEAIRGALDRILDPDVYIRAGLASTPDAARVIIAGLPGVQELINIGPEAVPEILSLLKRAEEQQDPDLAGIALYLLQRIPAEEARKPLARAISEGKFAGLNMHLAADALLTLAKTETVNENRIMVALREAEKLKE